MAIKLLLRARSFILLAILTVLIAGCASSSTSTTSGGFKGGPGVDTVNKTITLGVLTPLSGGAVADLIGKPLTRGVEVYFDYINDNGGIGGYKVKLVEKDNKYPSTTDQVEQYNAIHNDVTMIAESLGTPTTFAIKDLAAKDQLLVSAATLASSLARQQYLILLGTPYRLQVENAFDFLVNKKGVAHPDTAILYQNDDYGIDGLSGYLESIKAYGLNDLGQVPFNPGSADYTAQISKLKTAGAKYVFLTSTPGDTAKIIGTGHALGFDPQWILQSPAFATFLLKTPVAPLLAAEAWVVGQGAIWGDTSKPGMATMLQNIQKYASDQQPDGFFQFGYTESIITAAILKQAFANNDLSRAGLLKAFESLKNVDLGGLYPNPSYGSSPNQRVPTRDNSIFALDLTATASGGVKDLSGDFVGSAAMTANF